MIQSYNEEIRWRRNIAAIFWLIVFIFSMLLYMFFQWYYLNINFESSNKKDIVPIEVKRYWIINMQVVPTPEKITINKQDYSNWSKKKVDYWDYNVSITNSWYIPVNFNIEINNNFSIFYETISQFKKFKYKAIDTKYDDIEKVDNYYLAFSNKNKIVNVLDNNLKPKDAFVTDYPYIWHKYFSNNWEIYIYDADNNFLKPFSDKDEKQVNCRNARVYHYRLFCYDVMDFIDWSKMEWSEKVLRINDNLILTNWFVYNNWNWWDWWTYELSPKYYLDPENIVHIDNLPFILEDWLLYKMEANSKTVYKLDDFDSIKTSYEFWNEVILIGNKSPDVVFSIYDEKKKYWWKLWNIDPKRIKVVKLNDAYFFLTDKNIYLYYKGAEKIIKILDWEDIKLIWNEVFFKKNWNNYHLNLSN